jgi:hypothetical protein
MVKSRAEVVDDVSESHAPLHVRRLRPGQEHRDAMRFWTVLLVKAEHQAAPFLKLGDRCFD